MNDCVKSEDRQAETKDHDRPHQHVKTMWRVDKHECRREIDQQRRQLDQHEPVEFGSSDNVFARPNVAAPERDFAQRQKLNQTEHERAEQWQLQQVAADSQVSETPCIQHPQNKDRQSTEIEETERPVMNCSVSERRKHDRDADHEKRKPARKRVPDAIDAALRSSSLAASGAGLSATTTLVSSFETEVVIPNRTKNRTHRRLFSAARNAHDLENHCFRLFAGLEA